MTLPQAAGHVSAAVEAASSSSSSGNTGEPARSLPFKRRRPNYHAAEGGNDGAGLTALRACLAALDATAPWFVYRKTLTKTDVDPRNNRLLIPCHRRSTGACHRLTAAFMAHEMGGVHDKFRGMEVPAFDGHGRRYDLMFKYLQLNGSYRFLGADWAHFVSANYLADAMRERDRGLEIELWAFRSPALLPEGGEEAVHHPHGALGMAILIKVRQNF